MPFDANMEAANLESLWKRGVPLGPPGESEEDRKERLEPHQKEPVGSKKPLSEQGKWKAEKDRRWGGTKPKKFSYYDAVPSSVRVVDGGVDNLDPEGILIDEEEQRTEGESEDLYMDKVIEGAYQNIPSIEEVVSAEARGISRKVKPRDVIVNDEQDRNVQVPDNSGIQFSPNQESIHPRGNKERSKFTKKEERDSKMGRKVGAMEAETKFTPSYQKQHSGGIIERIEKSEKVREKGFEELLDRLNKKITEGEFGTKTTEKVTAELERLRDLFPKIYQLYSIGFNEQKKRVFYRKYSESSEMRKTA